MCKKINTYNFICLCRKICLTKCLSKRKFRMGISDNNASECNFDCGNLLFAKQDFPVLSTGFMKFGPVDFVT